MDLSLVSLDDMLTEIGNRYTFVMAFLEYEGGIEVVKLSESDKGKFIEKAGLISFLQNDWFNQFDEEEEE